jgi:hypothetical protein
VRVLYPLRFASRVRLNIPVDVLGSATQNPVGARRHTAPQSPPKGRAPPADLLILVGARHGRLLSGARHRLRVRGRPTARSLQERAQLSPRSAVSTSAEFDPLATASIQGPALWHDWIEIGGQPGTGLSPMRIGRRKMTRQIWDALVRAGAQPIGPPPQP